MYAHIGRLAILHISITYVYWYILEKKKIASISGIRA